MSIFFSTDRSTPPGRRFFMGVSHHVSELKGHLLVPGSVRVETVEGHVAVENVEI